MLIIPPTVEEALIGPADLPVTDQGPKGWFRVIDKFVDTLSDFENTHKFKRLVPREVFVVPRWVGDTIQAGTCNMECFNKYFLNKAAPQLATKYKEFIIPMKVGHKHQKMSHQVWGAIHVKLWSLTITCSWSAELGLKAGVEDNIEDFVNLLLGRFDNFASFDTPAKWSWRWTDVRRNPALVGAKKTATVMCWWIWRFWKGGEIGYLHCPLTPIIENWLHSIHDCQPCSKRLDELVEGGPRGTKGTITGEDVVEALSNANQKLTHRSLSKDVLNEREASDWWASSNRWTVPKPSDHYRILSQNVDGWSEKIAEPLWSIAHMLHVDTLMLQDIRWSVKQQSNLQEFGSSSFTGTSDRWSWAVPHKLEGKVMGGTAVITTGVWAARTIKKGCDPRGWGRYSYQVLEGREGSKCVMVVLYTPCSSNEGTNGLWSRFQSILREDKSSISLNPWVGTSSNQTFYRTTWKVPR